MGLARSSARDAEALEKFEALLTGTSSSPAVTAVEMVRSIVHIAEEPEKWRKMITKNIFECY